MFRKLMRKIRKLHFYAIWDGEDRARYLKRKKILKSMGENCLYQSRIFPMDPKLVVIHNNVTIAANVVLCTHDAIRHVFMNMDNKSYEMNRGPIEIEDNVFIGAGTIILPNVRIGKNVIIGAGTVVNKDVPANSVVCGNPAKVVGDFFELKGRREKLVKKDENLLWKEFKEMREKKV